jgi:2-polyprenyl-3-methyl-5-hydroxy-6-metoxy-1,4-benzoquinol methylase
VDDNLALPANVEKLFEGIRAGNMLHYRFVAHAATQLSADEMARLEAYIGFCLSRGLTQQEVCAAYLTIVNDTMREQAYFRKHRRYRFSSFAEVANSVYFDDAYMSRYMYGLAISSFLWPNHLDLLRYFRATLPTARTGRYLEIGPGHGYFLLTAMQHSAFTDFLGIDISQTSIDQTGAVITHFAPDLAPRAKLECMDFLLCDLPKHGFDAVVMGEVLEHVETPQVFLDRIRLLAAPDAHIYITTCINAPAVDHICLFETLEQLEGLFAASGLGVRDQLIRPYEGKSVQESLDNRLPMNVAYVLGVA